MRAKIGEEFGENFFRRGSREEALRVLCEAENGADLFAVSDV